ncbi:MAG: hypothetical protein WAT79_02310 [Saprospiraceae bacterium]
MKTFIYNFKYIVALVVIWYSITNVNAQTDSTKWIQRIPVDTSTQKLNMDAVYNRPFLTAGKLPIAIGGYMEANTQYASTDGVTDGLSFQARRFTLFFSSTIAKKIKFLSELEFEDGTKEINIEFAAMDVEFHPLLQLRGGIVMNPIGAFNQNHDGPRWDFIDRPISSTTIIPSTLANVGFGLHGKYFAHNWIIGYETYLTNGFDDNIISNSDNRTSLVAGKSNPVKFEESNSGLPMFTGKLAIRNRNIGEIGLSYMSGVFNKYKIDGLEVDEKRFVRVFAVDFNTSLLNNRIEITGEVSKVKVDVPETYSQTFGTDQLGGFVDIIGTVLKRPMLGWEKAKLNVGVRLEYADYNQGNFNETDDNIGDDLWSIVPTIAFRPVGTTVLRFNYRYMQQTDLLGNPPSITGAYQFGFSTYF